MESKDMAWTARAIGLCGVELKAQAVEHNPSQLAERLIADDPMWKHGMTIRLEPIMDDSQFRNGLAIAIA